MQIGFRPRLRARSSLLDLVRARNEAQRIAQESSPLSSPTRPLSSLSVPGTSSFLGLSLGGPLVATGAASTEGAEGDDAIDTEERPPTAGTATSSAPPQPPRLPSVAALQLALQDSPPSSPHRPPTPPAPSSSRVPLPTSSAASTEIPAHEPDAAHVPASSKMAPVRPLLLITALQTRGVFCRILPQNEAHSDVETNHTLNFRKQRPTAMMKSVKVR